MRVVELALAARERTGGRFDPTVHDAVVAAGYDRSFEDVVPESDVRCQAPAVAGGGVSVDGSRIALEPGVRIDLGGIGKGYAAERAAELLALAGPCLVNAGGDVATRGGSWPVGVETAGAPLTLELAGAALATSGRDRRRWRRGGRELHHLIDPRTGAPSETDLLRVTVVAPDAVEAEVAAKALFLAGADAAARRGGRGGARRGARHGDADGARRRARMTHDPTFWLLARASGLTAYALMTCSVLAGLVVKSRPFGRALKTASATDVHRFLALLGLGMLVLHGVSLTLDQTVHMPVAALFVPGASAYRPGSVALGVLACELAALIVLSFSFRRRIGARNWRRLHWATYLIFAMATAHGLASGTDSSQPWAFGLYLGAVGAVAFATAWRALTSPTRPTPKPSVPVAVPERSIVMYRIVIDRSLCSGFGACAELAPEIFEVDDGGLVSLRVGTSDDSAVLDAAAACPMAAITVVEEAAA